MHSNSDDIARGQSGKAGKRKVVVQFASLSLWERVGVWA